MGTGYALARGEQQQWLDGLRVRPEASQHEREAVRV